MESGDRRQIFRAYVTAQGFDADKAQTEIPCPDPSAASGAKMGKAGGMGPGAQGNWSPTRDSGILEDVPPIIVRPGRSGDGQK